MKNLLNTLFICTITCVLLPFSLVDAADGDKDKPAERGGKKRPEGRPGKGKPGDLFKKLDTNDDHAISKEEAGEHWERMGKLDKDGDGKVTGKEMMAGRPDGPGRPGKDGKKGDGKKRGDFKPGDMFKRADKNEDGKIAKDEVPAEAWERLSRADKNRDGFVDKKEMGAAMAMRKKDGPPGNKEGEDKFKQADKNSDEKLTEDEVPAEFWARIGKFDKNGDKGISKEEIAAGFRAAGGGPDKMKGPGGRGGPSGGPDAIFGKMDENKDGKLSKDEVPAEMWAKLSNADNDADGTVSKAELEKVFKERAARMGGGDKPRKKKE